VRTECYPAATVMLTSSGSPVNSADHLRQMRMYRTLQRKELLVIICVAGQAGPVRLRFGDLLGGRR
jgi:hypothetical protein